MIETIAYRVIYTILLTLLSCQNMNGNAKVLKRTVLIGTSAVVVFWLHSVPLRGESAADLLRTSGVRGGLVVHAGCGDGSLTADLRAGVRLADDQLEIPPVFDGLIAAKGNVYLTDAGGNVNCWKGGS